MTENKKTGSSSVKEHNLADEFPPPPPPDSLQSTLEFVGCAENLPPVPPKETFSKFYQQRQVNEVRRLYRHMHPELRKNFEEALNEELTEMLNDDDPDHQTLVNLDTVLPGEVQSMRWIFENWSLDAIGEQHAMKKLKEEESIVHGDVKSASVMFENQTFDTDSSQFSTSTKLSDNEQSSRGVRSAVWLFESQPMDSLNKIYSEDRDMQEAVLKESVQPGDVKSARLLFESYPLDALGRCNSVEEHSLLQLQSEIQEMKGNVKRTVKLFQAEPLCAIRDNSGNVHQIKTICREEIQSNNVKTARWLFETQPLSSICKDSSEVKIIRGISLEESQKGGVAKTRWMFETQSLDTIKEFADDDNFLPTTHVIEGADVSKQRRIFETQPLDSLKGDSLENVSCKEEIIGGNVKSTLWLFETQPMENLKESFEVGQLKHVVLNESEKGSVKERKHVFETQTLDSIFKESSELQSKISMDEVEKGDVKLYKHLFETLPLDSIKDTDGSSSTQNQQILPGNVKGNRTLFETTPLYAIKDGCGNYHEVTSVSREKDISGDVKHCKWMFETKPLDQFNDDIKTIELIEGITKQEINSGDVRTVRWLFETQPIDVIHYQKNQAGEHSSARKEVSPKGDVNTCRWLFETQPVDSLYEKTDNTQKEKESIPKANVKSYTWMFETQPMDTLKESGELYLKVSGTYQDTVKGVDVKNVKHIFETEPLDSISCDSKTENIESYKSDINIESGTVLQVKKDFQKSNFGEVTKSLSVYSPEDENIQAGSVRRFTWLFENCPMDTIKEVPDSSKPASTITDITRGDVGNKRFVFETYSLDQIHDRADESEFIVNQKETESKGDVKCSTMLFESQPLYAIRDKDGQYHEVTTVKKEEIIKGDVKGARWLFETKPLDTIRPDDEIFVIRAVTQEDVQKGDVKAARWRFETEPLDTIKDEQTPIVRTVDDIQKGDVQSNKEIFESQKASHKKYVRTVSVSDAQHGDVRTSTWLFETQPVDKIKGENLENSSASTVHREDIQKGDVKRCTWLFETQPLDSLKDSETAMNSSTEEMPHADVKSTTWLFETTSLDKVNAPFKTDTNEIMVECTKESLKSLYDYKVIWSNGIMIETSDVNSVMMTKYQLIGQNIPDIVKQETVSGNLQRLMMQVLHRTNMEPEGVLVKEDYTGNVQLTKLPLLNQGEPESSDAMDQAIHALFNQDAFFRKGIVLQETANGHVHMSIYSLLNKTEYASTKADIVRGDVKSTIGNLLTSSQEQKASATVKREENERGNVHFYKTCIEQGALDYLKNLHQEEESEETSSGQLIKEEVVHGDIQGAKQNLMQQKAQVEKTVADVVPGDVKSTKKVFMSEKCTSQSSFEKEVLYGDIDGTMLSLKQSTEEPMTVEKEEIISGDVKAAIRSLEEAKIQSRKVNKEMIIPGKLTDMKPAFEETESTKTKSDNLEETLDVQKSSDLQKDANYRQYTEHEETEKNDLQVAMQSLRQAAAEAQSIHQQVQNKFQKGAQNQVDVPDHVSVIHKTCQKRTAAPEKYTSSASVQCSSVSKQASSLDVHQESSSSSGSRQMNRILGKKVSDTKEIQDSILLSDICQENKIENCADDSLKDGVYFAKQVNTFVNPFNRSEFMQQTLQEEAAQENIVKGDVKAAIKSLQSAATEQKLVEKEDVVRGNIKSALQSLEKSNVNVSKGDFKAAMIYKNAGRSYQADKKKECTNLADNKGVITSVPQSDNDSPPSLVVNNTEHGSSSTLPTDALVSQTNKEEDGKGNLKSYSKKCVASSYESSVLCSSKVSQESMLSNSAITPKSASDIKKQTSKSGIKPALPPKPAHLKSISSRQTQSEPGKAHEPPANTKQACHSSPIQPEVQHKHSEVQGPIKYDSSNCSKHQHFKYEVCPLSSSSVNTNLQHPGTANKPQRVTKTPLQIAEEKYKKSKEQNITSTADKTLESDALNKSASNLNNSQVDDNEVFPSSEKDIPADEIQGSLSSYTEEDETRRDIPFNFKTTLNSFERLQKQPSLPTRQARTTKEGCSITENSQVFPPPDTSVYTSPTPQDPCYNLKNQATESMTYSNSQGHCRASAVESFCQQTEYPVSHTQGNIQNHALWADCGDRYTEQEKCKTSCNENKVMMREKRQKRETEDERWKRLSIHKEKILQGNVKAAMEIFENLRKQEELQSILSKVEELEEDTCKVDVKALRNLFENVPEWVVETKQVDKQWKPAEQQTTVHLETKKNSENVSSVKLAFEDLERASEEIINLKEQTLARLLDIEEAIKKALYSVSNLKSESDIAGLSGLFKESLKISEEPLPTSNVSKISPVTTKPNQSLNCNVGERTTITVESEIKEPLLNVQVVQPRVNSPSSPSYICIESAARKPDGAPKNTSPQGISCESPSAGSGKTALYELSKTNISDIPQSRSHFSGSNKRCPDARDSQTSFVPLTKDQQSMRKELETPEMYGTNNTHIVSNELTGITSDSTKGVMSDYAQTFPGNSCPSSSTRKQKSVLEFQTRPAGAEKIGTKTVSEKYEETDPFGNKIITSKTSRTVTKQSETNTSSTYEVVPSAPRYGCEVMTPPLVRRHLHNQAENSQPTSKLKESGLVFVTFGNSKSVKK
ncbi:xin actin-binding repeat-containing protein 1-like [Protopterus annectens]|uniref:xin actin-binding repeat-containing protein 1-like n=1 Tax=Protopterus annectens TaxID=7888 RepID=UPI001CF9E0FE|nr:xin actin-binding repeat-containing protein 1-like [Protopterus annectens]